MMMKRLFVFVAVLLVAAPAMAKTRAQLLLDFRKTTGDQSAATSGLIFPDSVANYFLNAALSYAGTRSLGFIMWDTLTLSSGTTQYALTRKSIMPRFARLLAQDGKTQGVPYVSSEDISLKPQAEAGWALIDTLAVVTEGLARKYKLTVVYVAKPSSMDSAGADCELPDALEDALVQRAAGMAFVSTRVPALVQIGAGYQTEAKEAFDDYAVRHVLRPTDSLGLGR